MMNELKACIRLQKDIAKLPHVPSDASISDTVLESEDGESYNIIGLTCCTRFCLYVLVVIPKFSICLLLTHIGCRWLTATESFSDLILNALALEFVIGVDENILEFFLPQSCR